MVEAATGVRWVPAGERVVVGRRRLDAGLVYVGEGTEPSAIDPTLPVDRARADWHAESTTRPPRYSELTPGARAAYLVWLETGRRAEQAPSIWALLHLYGLERRLLLEGDDDPALHEEVRSLDEIYGHDPDVHRIATALLPPEGRIPELTDTDAVPDELRVGIGRRALSSTPIDAAWARAWAWFHPAIPRPAAATLATELFSQRWEQVFAEEHPGGLVVAPRRRRLTLEHVPYNPSLPSPVEITVDDASDVVDAPGPEQALRTITERVGSELETHVRWLRRHPDAGSSASALGTIPHGLVETSGAAPAARPFTSWAEAALRGRERCVVAGRDLVDRWRAIDGQPGFGNADALALARVLDQFGVGVEPDVRFGGAAVGPDAAAVLFRFERPPVTSPSPAYATALLTLELCTAVASADGTPDDAEEALLVEQVGRVEDLLDGERARLAAHRDLLRMTSIDLDDVATRIGALDLGRRRRLGDYLVEVAQVDGEVSDAERATLAAVHEILGLAAPTLGPAPGGLDQARLRATRASNAEVQELLAAIFAEEESEDGAPGPEPEPEEPGIGTLDARHSALLRELAAVGTWSRSELEHAARRHGLLPDGALEIINEAALDATGEQVVEPDDDESVTIEADVYRGMAE